ncbi:MAG: hypothetical protein ABH986_00590 [archaeon]
MNKLFTKLIVFLLIALLLLIFFLSILGYTDIINFWIAAVIVTVFAFVVLPKLNKQVN